MNARTLHRPMLTLSPNLCSNCGRCGEGSSYAVMVNIRRESWCRAQDLCCSTILRKSQSGTAPVFSTTQVVKRLPLKLELAQNIRNLPVDPLVQVPTSGGGCRSCAENSSMPCLRPNKVGGADVLGKLCTKYFHVSAAI